MWYFVFLSNFGICYKCTVWYRYLLLRIAIHIGAPVSAVCRCIVSALILGGGGVGALFLWLAGFMALHGSDGIFTFLPQIKKNGV